MSMQQIVEMPLVKLDGSAIPPSVAANLAQARVELVSNGAGQATLSFYDATFQLVDDAAFGIGKELAIAFPMPNDARSMTTVFTGEIVGLAVEQGPDDLHEFVVTAFDHGHRLARAREPKVWLNVTYTDLMNEFASRHGLSASIEATTIVFDHLWQTSDDATTLTDICNRTGMTWRVAQKRLVVQPAGTETATVTWGDDLFRFTSRLGAAGPTDRVQVRGWDAKRKQAIVGTAAAPATGLSNVGKTSAVRAAGYGAFGKNTRVVTDVPVESQSEATDLAEALHGRMDSTVTGARGEVWGNPALVPGMKLTVKGVGVTFGGDYVLSDVQHVYTPRGYVTRFHAGTRTPSTLLDVLGGAAPRGHEAMIAIVTNNKDPDGLGRVKVKFPTISESLESNWARVAIPGGGNTRGLHMLPSVNDEVLVVFESGDMRRPIVLGGLWSGQDAPPKRAEELQESGATRVWYMQTPSGHLMTFDDRDGQEAVSIVHRDGETKLNLHRDKVELWTRSNTIQLKTGQSTVTLSNSDIKLDSPSILLKATQSVKIEAPTVDVAASGVANVKGGSVNVEGQASTVVKAGATVALNGAIVKIN